VPVGTPPRRGGLGPSGRGVQPRHFDGGGHGPERRHAAQRRDTAQAGRRRESSAHGCQKCGGDGVRTGARAVTVAQRAAGRGV
jgi:excinuclease UvrABC ATPase subunit